MRERRKYNSGCLEDNLFERYEIKDPFSKFLEEIVDRGSIVELDDSPLITYLKPLTKNTKSDHINSKSKAQVIYVSPYELPSGPGWKVLGQYDPRNHTILIANNLDPKTTEFVYYHEEAHSVGILSERLADNYAAAKVGYMLDRNFDYGMAA